MKQGLNINITEVSNGYLVRRLVSQFAESLESDTHVARNMEELAALVLKLAKEAKDAEEAPNHGSKNP